MKTAVVVLSAIVLALVFWFVEEEWKKIKARKAAGLASSRGRSPQTISAQISEPLEMAHGHVYEEQFERPSRESEPTPEVEDGKSIDVFRRNLRALFPSGKKFDVAFPEAFEPLRSNIDMMDALKEAAEMDWPLVDIAAFMSHNGYVLQDIAEVLKERPDASLARAVEALAPLATGNNGVERATDLFQAVYDSWQVEGDEESLVEPFQGAGFSKEEIAEMLYRKTNLGIGNVIAKTGIKNSVEISSLSKSLNLDLDDEDTYKDIRGNDISFPTMAAILKEAGSDASKILTLEDAYSDLDLEEASIENMFEVLVGAGFTRKEILDGIWSSELTSDDSAGQIVSALHTAQIPIDELAWLINEVDVDLDDLDEGLRDENLDLKDRINILHAVLSLRETA